MTESRRGDVERGFSMTLGRVFEPDDRGLLLAVALDGDDNPAGFCQYVPARAIDGWSLDLMRRSEAPRRAERHHRVHRRQDDRTRPRARRRSGSRSNFATFRAVLASEAGDRLVQRAQKWFLERVGDSMQIESLWTFNEKFQPEWHPRYAAYDSPEHILERVDRGRARRVVLRAPDHRAVLQAAADEPRDRPRQLPVEPGRRRAGSRRPSPAAGRAVRCVTGSGPRLDLEREVVDVAVVPVLAGLERLDDRVRRSRGSARSRACSASGRSSRCGRTPCSGGGGPSARPMSRHSTQPLPLGATATMWSRWVQVSATACSLPNASSAVRSRRLKPKPKVAACHRRGGAAPDAPLGEDIPHSPWVPRGRVRSTPACGRPRTGGRPAADVVRLRCDPHLGT